MTETNISPERAIKNSDEDVLGYSTFVEKMVPALINKDEKGYLPKGFVEVWF